MLSWRNSFSGMVSMGNELRRPAPSAFLPKELQGMSMTQLCSLPYILDYEADGVFQKDIETFLRIRRSSVSSLLNKMERGGLLFRTPVPEDARLKQLHLTDKGRTLAAEIVGIHAHMEQYVKRILTAEEVVTLNAILQKITDSMDGLMDAIQSPPPK